MTVRLKFKINGAAAASMAGLALAVAAPGAGASGVTPGSSTPPPLSVFAALPNVSQVSVSPDGTGLAWVIPDRTGRHAVVYANRVTRSHQVISLNGSEPTFVRFEEGGALLIGITVTMTWPRNDDIARLGRIIVYRPDTGVTFAIEPVQGRPYIVNELSYGIESVLPDLPEHISIISYNAKSMEERRILPHFLTINLQTGLVVSETVGRTQTVDWLGGADGSPHVRLDFDADRRRGAILLRDPATDRWESVFDFEDVPVPPVALIAATSDNRIILKVLGSQYGRYVLFNPRTRTREDLVSGDGREVSGLILDPLSNAPLGVRMEGLWPFVRWLDPDMEALQGELDARFPQQTVAIGSMSRDRSVVAFSVGSATAPPTWYILDKQVNQVQRIGHTYPALAGDSGVRFEATHFAARDGLQIPVYITYPAGWDDSKRGPMVVMPHGGPQARDYPDFDWWSQFMVSRGYAVVQPQFRGSSGFGLEFALAGFREWGGKMQDDVSDAVRWAVSRGLADPGRVCIVGASYGGYAALAGATLTPELYACAVSVAGVSDLRALLVSDQRAGNWIDSIASNYWAEHIGRSSDRELDAVSPAKLVNRIRAPILLIHGQLDTVVPVEQSRIMVRSMERAGRAVKLVELPGTGHSLNNAEARTRLLQEIETFLAEHLAPAGAARATTSAHGASEP